MSILKDSLDRLLVFAFLLFLILSIVNINKLGSSDKGTLIFILFVSLTNLSISLFLYRNPEGFNSLLNTINIFRIQMHPVDYSKRLKFFINFGIFGVVFSLLIFLLVIIALFNKLT